MPSGATSIPPGVLIDSPALSNYGVSPIDGYKYIFVDGDATTGTLSLGSDKVVIFVNGNLSITGNINLTPGSGFFAAFVKRNITIFPSVSSSSSPALEGIFFADGNISTGTSKPNPDNQLYVRGSLISLSGRVNLQRDLDPARSTGQNNTKPAEYIEFSPDLIVNFPLQLMRSGVLFEEVAP